jgi:hypothetical protein
MSVYFAQSIRDGQISAVALISSLHQASVVERPRKTRAFVPTDHAAASNDAEQSLNRPRRQVDRSPKASCSSFRGVPSGAGRPHFLAVVWSLGPQARRQHRSDQCRCCPQLAPRNDVLSSAIDRSTAGITELSGVRPAARLPFLFTNQQRFATTSASSRNGLCRYDRGADRSQDVVQFGIGLRRKSPTITIN